MLQSLQKRFCALAKKREEVYVVNRREPLASDANAPAVLLLRALRDEVICTAVAGFGMFVYYRGAS